MSNNAATGVTISPAGHPMNCNSWGTYEAPNTSPTAGFCNGGTVDGELWAPCPSKLACMNERSRRSMSGGGGTRLPIQGQQQSNVRVVGQAPRSYPGYPTTPSYPTYGSAPTTIPQRQPTQTVVTPTNNNPYLDTPRVGMGGDHSPTFLPAPEEPFMRRLMANMFVGALEAVGHHLSSFMRNVDIFPFKGPGPKT